ncbi:GNAT family N-acetyltransferase [Cellulomonas bogoriensis]|uniref:GCN5 family acetyltransferase n=1 Tax=Cellulomonas bogoriensis 69B4 = DSM 16987 TaxID=1386082 RepID=A0A0A0C1H8_9CELL|nr:GNAT family N-acetyltransferase [Cellulomonas bogoriensis]KGM13792.1 GCN5 family acetyltransferase [Cellulomonas bogoriensis 69B4 = DSM 16987]
MPLDHSVPTPLAAPLDPSRLPDGWTVAPAEPGDAAPLHVLLTAHEQVAHGSAATLLEQVEAVVAVPEGPFRHHLVVRDADGAVRAWATMHDRAAGRAVLALVLDPGLPDEVADPLAATLLDWAVADAQVLGRARGVATTQLDTGRYAGDERQGRWYRSAGLTHARTWLQMSRPVTPADALEGAFPAPHPQVRVRRVRRATDGMPEPHDLTTVHDVLEEAFTDHFNHREETLEEFLTRLREDPGHRWDHWWIAELAEGDAVRPAGALVGAVNPGRDGQPDGSYLEYLGVLRTARGRGVATTLLHTAITDAATRGRDRVGLEVDADSPTGAVDLYTSLGFTTSYVTESWHLDVPVDG